MRPLLLTLGFWLIPASVVAQQVQAFAVDSIPAHLDSVVVRSRKDTTIQTLKQPGIIIWTTPYRNRQHLRDSLVVWCTRSCKWEWDGVVDMPDSLADAPTNFLEVSNALVRTWGGDSIHAPAVWAMGYTGQGVKVASLDSGIDPTHPGYVVGGGYNAVTNESGTNFWDDIAACNGHGTHVGGTLADRTGRGVAPGSLLFGLKVFENINGQCLSYTSRQISALNYAVNNNIRVVNISIGGMNNSLAYQDAITNARRAGVLIAAANGNSGATPALMPGRADSLLGVASVNPQLQRSGFSNYGPTTDLSAPGEGIESTLPGGGYGQKSGTSMASPHVAASAALVMSAEPTISTDSVASLLRLSALPLGAQPNEYTGYGLVRPDRAIALHRGGVWVAGPVQDTVRAFGEKCYPMVAVRPYTVGVTAGVRWRQAGDTVCVTMDSLTPRQIQITALAQPPLPILQIDLATRYQTMSGWEATAQAGQAAAGYAGWQSALMDSAAALGINRMRMELPSGVENTVDYYGQFRAGTITSAQFNAQRYAWVNDNADPATTNAAGYQWTKLDETMDQVVVPLRNRLLARGDSLFLSMDYVSFGGSTAQADPNEYAELLLAAFQHLQGRYGFVPDAVEAILEPDNNTIWNGTAIGRAIAAAGARLAAAGFRPEFVSPSVMDMSRAVAYLDAIVAVPGASTYLKEVSYHRYGGVSDANLTAIATRARVLGLRTGMLEHIGSGIDDLLADLTVGNASAWQQYTLAYPTADNGAQYFPIIGGQVTVGTLARQLFPVFQAVRRGAVRVGSSAGVAFQQSSGVVVILRTRGAVSYEVRGLPVKAYEVTFTAENGSVSRWPFTGVLSVPGAGVAVVQ